MIGPIVILSISAISFCVFFVTRNQEKAEAIKAIQEEKLTKLLKFSKTVDYENGVEINDKEQ
jgi:hypothetical protein